jgi:FMN hydrolase / 5-amino-6-(5-phospho-D-ribitylamino)uracil phosphatase
VAEQRAVSVILWDVMDTLVRDPFFTHMAPFLGLTFEELLARKHPTAWGEFELGKISEAQLFERFFRDGTPIDGEGFKRCVADAYAWIEGVEPVLQELSRTGVAMHALSNYPHWYQLIDERLGVSRYVELSFISCHTGVRKPSADAYTTACARLGRSPAECLFIDDRASNCRAAEAVGLRSFHFEGNVSALRRALTDYGLLGSRD